jgi:hypothetical protein
MLRDSGCVSPGRYIHVAMSAVRVRVLKGFLLGLGACLLGACLLVWLAFISVADCPNSAAIRPDSGGSVWFDLTPVLAKHPSHVRVLACVEQTCVRRDSSYSREPIFTVNHAGFTDPETIDVRLVLRDDRGVIFDATHLIEPDESQPYGRCGSTLFNAGVLATPAGELSTVIPASV